MTMVKICGLRTVEAVHAAVEAGADMIGLVFAPSQRRIDAAAAATLAAVVRAHPAGKTVRVVGLFVNEAPATINALVAQCGLDYVQLSGTEDASIAAELHAPILKTVRLAGAPDEAGWLAGVPGLFRLLVDAHVPGAYGGTGQRADWERAAALAQQQPVLLAGGLNPANVADALARVHPWGVDVSGGVEHHGQKDPARIHAFVAAARAAGSTPRVGVQ